IMGFGLQPTVLCPLYGVSLNGLFASILGQQGAYIGMVAVMFAGVEIVAVQGYCLTYRLAVVLRNERLHHILTSWWGQMFAHVLGIVAATALSLPMYSLAQEGMRCVPKASHFDFAAY